MSTSRRLRLVAGAGAAAIAAATLSIVGAGSAQAAEPTPSTFTWLFSDYIHRAAPAGQFAAPVVSDGATVDSTSGKVTFVDGEGRTDTGTHATTVAYEGTASFSDSHGGTNYTVTFSDPTVTIDGDGDGTVAADIAWAAVGESPGSAADVTLTSFTAAETAWDGAFAFTATPDWTNEVPADAYATGKPVNGASWGQGFVTSIPASIRAFFYASGSSSDAAKAPSPFTAVVPGPAVSATSAAQGPSGVSFNVSGTGFSAVTNPGDAGVYVGLAPAGGLPDVSSPEGMSSFADAAYITPGQIVDGAFTTALSATPDLLTEGTAYSVYTWQAHAHSNTSQDTETPVEIDWLALQPLESTVATGGAASTTYGKTATVTATVPDSGTVTLTGLGAAQEFVLDEAGTATFTVPATLKAGSHTASFAYSGGGEHAAATATKKFTVAKAGTTVDVKVAPKPTAKKAGKATVTLKGASGKVVVTVKGAGKTVKKTVTVNARGKAVVALAKAPKGGAFTVTAAYAGDANHKASSDRASYKVAKPKVRKK